VVRVAAILLVIGRHQPDYSTAWPRVQPLLATWHAGGWIGVDIFFVLSGFLIGSILLEEIQSSGRIRIGRFYGRRGFKIYPAFYAFLGIYALLHAMAGDRSVSTGAWLSEVFFLQSYLPGVFVHTWSLAVEEHFYLALPIVLVALRLRPQENRRNLLKVSVAGAAIAVVCLALRITVARRHPSFDVYTHVFPSHLRIDALFGGVVLACLWQNHREWFQRLRGFEGALLILGLLFLVPPFVLAYEHPLINTVGLTFNALGAGLIMVAVLLWDSTRPSVRAIAWLGPYTYSIYLWHVVVGRTVSVLLPITSFGVVFTLYVAGSLIAGIGMAKAIEVPALALRERVVPKAGPPPTQIIEATTSALPS
jgi:peptidoglycan/LPS O-acetylase OafA/YrhL